MNIISNGIIPAGMEIMDKVLLEATNNFSKAGYPLEAEAMLIVELDGTKSEVDELIDKVKKIAKKNKSSSMKISKSDEERLKFWSGRKAAFPACGEMAPDYYCVDGTIPRGKLAKVLREITKLSKKTRTDNMKTFPNFSKLSQVPKFGLTVGLHTISQLSKKVILVLTMGIIEKK